MGKRRLAWFVLSVWLVVQLACTMPGTASPTATAGAAPIVSGGSNPSNGQATASPSPSPTPSPTLTPTLTPTPTPSPSPTPTETPTPQGSGPFVVQQILTLGGEKISGVVCSLKQPFTVNSVTPKVTFNFIFTPLDGAHGNVAYQYTIQSAGESHDAGGTYKVGKPDAKGVQLLTMTGKDHVVFHGFDDNIPFYYRFNLVPIAGQSCP